MLRLHSTGCFHSHAVGWNNLLLLWHLFSWLTPHISWTGSGKRRHIEPPTHSKPQFPSSASCSHLIVLVIRDTALSAIRSNATVFAHAFGLGSSLSQQPSPCTSVVVWWLKGHIATLGWQWWQQDRQEGLHRAVDKTSHINTQPVRKL